MHGIVLCRVAWQGSGGIGLLTLFTLLQLQMDANEGSSSSDEDKRAPIISSCLYHSSTSQAGLLFLRYVSLVWGQKTRVEKMSQIRRCSQERCNSLEPCFLLQRQISAEPQRVSGHGRGQDCLSSGNLITCL